MMQSLMHANKYKIILLHVTGMLILHQNRNCLENLYQTTPMKYTMKYKTNRLEPVAIDCHNKESHSN